MDEAFTVGKIISVDRSKSPSTLQIRIGDTHPATGEIDEKYLEKHTGSVSFPDENNKKYNFWYYPIEKKIYWTADKPSTTDIWTGDSDENSKHSSY